ncbi:YacP-like NYN domain protein [Planctomycetes bacterium MalM25]|nr:YacP-like NYN domain protein [Planctomycetes bacterium MalM25]
MRLLIDGYNLLHATDLFGAGELAGTLRGSREALVEFLVGRLEKRLREGTLIVFDAADAPPGLPDRYEFEGVRLRFARGYPDADTLIEEILEPLHGAKHLTVVSGDRRVQRAARSSGAKWVDSGPWFAGLCRRDPAAEPAERKSPPAGPVGTTADWVATFSGAEELARIEREAADAPLPKPPEPPPQKVSKEPAEAPAKRAAKRKKKRRPPLGDSGDKPRGGFGEGLKDPFPPGYGDDLLDGDESSRNDA